MKKLILLAAILTFSILSMAQNYGIELENDTTTRSNGKQVVNYVKTFPPRFMDEGIVMYFSYEKWNITDSLLVEKKKQVAVKLRPIELEHELFGKSVKNWLEETTKPNPVYPDSTVIKYIGQIVYDYKILGGN